MGSRVRIRLFHILHFVRDLLFPLLKNSKSGVDDRGHRLRITHTLRPQAPVLLLLCKDRVYFTLRNWYPCPLVRDDLFPRLIPVSFFVTSKNAFREGIWEAECAKKRRLVKSVIPRSMLNHIQHNEVV